MKTKVALVGCESYEPRLVQERVRKALDALGGIASLIKSGTKVLLKPNLLMAKPPEAAITTHPEVIRAVARLLKEIKCEILLGDGPSVWGNYAQDVYDVYERTGIKALADEEGIRLITFDRRRMHGSFPLTTALDEVDHIINLPKFKTHELTTLTGAVKNCYGLVPGTYKTELHKRHFKIHDFAKVVVDIFQAVGPHLVIVDGILAMEGDGPATSGTPRWEQIIVAGVDPVAVDSVLAKRMGLMPQDILTTRFASERNLGVSNLEHITVISDELPRKNFTTFKLPASSFKQRLPAAVMALAKVLIKWLPCIEQDHCLGCAACIQACPQKAIALRDQKVTINYRQCISCFCCQEACPSQAIRVRRSIGARLLDRMKG